MKRWAPAIAASLLIIVAVLMDGSPTLRRVARLEAPTVDAGGCVMHAYIDGSGGAPTPEAAVAQLSDAPAVERHSASPHQVWLVERIDGRILSAYGVVRTGSGWWLGETIRPAARCR